MENFGYFLLGAVITVVVSVFFYLRAGEQLTCEAKLLREETEKLRRLQELTIYALTNPTSNIQPTRDGDGKIVGLTVSAAGSSMAAATGRGTLTLTPTQASGEKS
jgi:hypothetical protein